VEAADMNDDSLGLLKRAAQYKDMSDYNKSQECLDKILENDPENHLAWYEKSKLPIVQEDIVSYKGRNVSLSRYLQYTLFGRDIYLQQCGFEPTEVQRVKNYLNVPNLLGKQRFKYLEMAIRYSPDNEKIIYESERTSIIAENKKKSEKDNIRILAIGITALITTVLAILKSSFFNIVLDSGAVINTIMMFVIPYVLSITGMVLYAKAKNNADRTIAGFICNLLALILSVLSMILVFVLFLIKA
jgi:tetratricopeptide (TPR) repeat protein